MNAKEAAAVIRRMSYKPNVELKADMSTSGDPATACLVLAVHARVPDATLRNPPPDHTIGVSLCGFLDYTMLRLMDERALLGWVRGEVLRMEEHECNEWLKLDGKCVKEPHPELRAQPMTFQQMSGVDKANANMSRYLGKMTDEFKYMFGGFLK